MAQASQGSARPPEFLSTRPAEETRVQQIDAWLPEALPFYPSPRSTPAAALRGGVHPLHAQPRFWPFLATQGRFLAETLNLLYLRIRFRL